MTTEKVFHNDQYLKTLEATITDIVISKERTEIITDRTIFSLRAVGNLVTEEPSIYQMIAAKQ